MTPDAPHPWWRPAWGAFTALIDSVPEVRREGDRILAPDRGHTANEALMGAMGFGAPFTRAPTGFDLGYYLTKRGPGGHAWLVRTGAGPVARALVGPPGRRLPLGFGAPVATLRWDGLEAGEERAGGHHVFVPWSLAVVARHLTPNNGENDPGAGLLARILRLQADVYADVESLAAVYAAVTPDDRAPLLVPVVERLLGGR